MNRNEMIERLVSFSADVAAQNPQADWTRGIFAKGLNGFKYMPLKKLEREMQLRGLLAFDDPEPVFDDDTDEGDLMVMLSRMVGAHCVMD